MTWRVHTPCGVAGRGDVARRLVRRLLEGPLDRLSGVVALEDDPDGPWVVVWGEPLPWVDGVVYLGAAGAGLWVSTRRDWEVPAELLVKRATTGVPAEELPLAWLDDALVPLGPGQRLDREELRALVGEGT